MARMALLASTAGTNSSKAAGAYANRVDTQAKAVTSENISTQ